jgi:penicillin-binding protein 1A
MNEISKHRKVFLVIFWGAFVFPFVFVAILFSLIANERLGFLPSFKDLENPKSNLSTEIISEDGIVLGYYYYQNRSRIGFDELSPNLVKAIISIEDIRFYDHSGIDARGLARVLIKTLVLGQDDAGGGSTITQQLAKNLFGRDTATYSSPLKRKLNLALAKFKEWVTAIRLEKNYTKDEILVMYLNTVFYGSGSYGIKSAAKTFFNKTPEELSIEESAMLAGVVNKPTRYNPVINPEKSIERRNVVLNRMEKYGFINKHTLDSLSKLPIDLEYKINDQNTGPAAYLREYIRVSLTANKPEKENYSYYFHFRQDSIRWANDPIYGWVNKNKKPDGSDYDIYSDGLKIYTTVNSKMQKYAEDAVSKHLGKDLQKDFFYEKRGRKDAPFSDELEPEQIENIINSAIRSSHRYWALKQKGKTWDEIIKIFNKPTQMTVFSWEGEKDTVMSPIDSILYYKHFLRAGFISIDPHNGNVMAYVGGINFKYFKYDHVIVGKRQVGSTIKPFLYTLAMQEGYSPCKRVPNVPQTFIVGDTTWTPRNSGSTDYDGKNVTLKWGLTNSVNNISAWLVKQFTPSSVVDIMRKMGIKSDIAAVPSLILGTSEISLYEMVGAYGTFSNKGVFVSPIIISRIEDKAGSIITEFRPKKKEAISEETAFKMVSLLQNVVAAGSGARLRYRYEIDAHMGGKTGTTQNQSDGWYIGVTPNLVSGAWVGGENRAIHFDGIALGQGANMALPIWAYYMQKVYADESLNINRLDSFPKPEGINADFNCDNYTDEQNSITDEMLIQEDYD